MNRKILFTWLFGMLVTHLSIAKNKSDIVTIEGHFNFDVKQKEVVLNHVVDGQPEIHTSTLINEEGAFAISLPVTTPGFYYIEYGQNNNRNRAQLIRLYLEPGLQMQIEIDESEYTLKGKRLGHNKLVQQANKINDAFAQFNLLSGLKTYKDFYPFVENEGVKMVNDFKNSINTKDEEFNEFLKLAVQVDFERELFHFFRLPRVSHPKGDEKPEAYAHIVTDGVKFSDKDILRLGNGLSYIHDYFFYYNFLHLKKRIAKVDIIKTNLEAISDARIKEVYALEELKRLRLNEEEYKVVIPPLYQYLTSEKSKAYLLEYEKVLHKEVGQPGFEFTYHDIEGNPVSFSDFRGKYVYIDVWATWCGPCKKEIPFLKEIEHDYKDKDIVFMSISVDAIKDKQKWKDFVKNESLGGVQLMADKAFKSGIAQNYEINAIPRFLLFDKEGKIISTNASRPSNPLLRKQLDRLLGVSTK
ncbi:TlpA disulfide reductase family protein [Zhouia amylolytica]|uniref:TlpA disulfide reductase family protein n=1 Tax=Zhouia amylolytica TaxID=376730 RepID=UPI0020CCE595|nr:TlpA disulfide reductase family protein [Zhouia amylolytica]MCQ0110557.1 AhpC/TSA family protein [Zhouia amylolytica]